MASVGLLVVLVGAASAATTGFNAVSSFAIVTSPCANTVLSTPLARDRHHCGTPPVWSRVLRRHLPLPLHD